MRARVEWALESAVVVGALATIPLTIAQERGAGGLAVVVGDWVVWSIFLLEYVTMLGLSTDRWSYARRQRLNLAVALMLTGLALVSTLAASIAAYFVGEDERAEQKRVAERPDRIEARLEERRASGPETDRATRREGDGTV